MASQMFDHALNALKGWPSPYALDFKGNLHEAVTIDPFPAGRCVHIHELDAADYGPGTSGGDAQFQTGVDGTQMALFTLQGSTSFDVANSGAGGGRTDWYAIHPRGFIAVLVATGAYELETTEYDTAQTYLPNEPLTGIVGNTDADPETGGGCLTNACEVYTDAVCGVVSRGTYTNSYGKSVLAFWPVYLPEDPRTSF